MTNLKNYRKLIKVIKTIDLFLMPDYEKNDQLLNKAIGELMVLTPVQIQLVLKELNEIYGNIKTFAEHYWKPEKFDFNNEISVLLYQRFLSESFFIKWKDQDNTFQLDFKTFHDIVYKVKVNSVILAKIKKRITPEIICKSTLIGFHSSLTDNQIDKLYTSLQGGYIETTPANFKAIFKNESLPDDFKPIELLKPFTVALCSYFVSELFQTDNPGDYWSIAENCFKVKNLRQSFNNAYQLNTNHKPRNHQKIDLILKNIYTPLQ